MNKKQITLLLLCLIGLVLFYQPVLQLVLKPYFFHGIPRSVWYVFIVWLLFILGLTWSSRFVTTKVEDD